MSHSRLEANIVLHNTSTHTPLLPLFMTYGFRFISTNFFEVSSVEIIPKSPLLHIIHCVVSCSAPGTFGNRGYLDPKADAAGREGSVQCFINEKEEFTGYHQPWIKSKCQVQQAKINPKEFGGKFKVQNINKELSLC